MSLASGVKGFITGTATTRWGWKVEGSEAHMWNITAMLVGVGLLLLGGCKIVATLF